MPTLMIGDKSVTVGDEFLKLSPAEQDAAVADIAKSLGVTAEGRAEAKAEPVTANQVVRAAANRVPLAGGLLNKANAAVNATLAPAIEPMLEPSPADISRPLPGARVGDVQLPGRSPTWSERFRKSEAMQNLADERFAREHPVVDTLAGLTGGVAGSIPIMMAAPAAFGLTGTLPQMVARGAASNAALAGADAAIRDEPVAPAAGVGGVVGAAAPVVARGVGEALRKYRELRNPQAPVRQNVETVAGVDVPLTEGQVLADPVKQAEEEIIRRGGRGGSAEAIARQADEEARVAVAQASENISRALDPTGAAARTAPQAAGEAVQSELAAQAAARQAAEAAQVSRVAAQGDALARNLGGGAPASSVFDAAEQTGAAVAARRAAAVERTKEAYRARDAVPGTFDDSVPEGLAENIRARLNTGENRLWVDPTNESVANQALKVIDQTLGRDTGVFANAAGPKPVKVAPEAGPAPAAAAPDDPTVAALRAQYGDDVANAYAKQQGKKAAEEPRPLSLLQFIASKGGLKPHAEVDAIGLGSGHREQIPGQAGFFSVVRKNGADIDRMREAAEEAGYLRGAHGETSTPAQFLDAIDAELRGQKVYPEGYAGFKSKREATAAGARETAERDQVMRGFERDLDEAGYGELGPEVRTRAVGLMHEEGMGADDAVEYAFRQLEQEDAAKAAARSATSGDSGFPGDRVAAKPAPAVRGPVDLKAMDEARKRLVTMFGDAKSAAIRTGDKSDMRAMGKILNEFDNVIGEALAAGKFSGDAALAKELQDAARKSHAEYRRMFSSRGPGDEVGRKVEKILGRYGDDAATPEEIMAMSYGPKSRPGTGSSVKVGLRLREALGENSAEYAKWKQGALSYVDDATLTPAKRATRIDEFLGTSWAKAILSADERAAMRTYARDLRATEPKAGPVGEVERAVARIAGTDGHLPASPVEVVDMLFGRTGKGDKGLSVRLATQLKRDLTPESWTAVRQGMWEKLTSAGEGKIPFEAQALSQRLHEFLNESGKPLANVLFTASERAEMAKLASIYKRMTPAKGSTNPSGTAPMLAKIARRASDNVLAMIGLGTGGVPGAIAGHAIQRAGEAVVERRAVRDATRLFFGPQARIPRPNVRLPQIIAPAAASAEQRA